MFTVLASFEKFILARCLSQELLDAELDDVRLGFHVVIGPFGKFILQPFGNAPADIPFLVRDLHVSSFLLIKRLTDD